MARHLRNAALLVVLLLLACTPEDHNTPPPTAAELSPRSPVDQLRGPLAVAVGDIACAPDAERTTTSCRDAETARLAEGYEPNVVLALGDLQYESGRLSDYRRSYARTWGSLKPITRPVPGNHDYKSEGAAGYYDYFRGRQQGAPGYYAFDVGTWRVYVLNSNCDVIDCRRQNRWLERQMSRDPRGCTAVAMHHPRYSSAEHGPSEWVRPFWETALRHRADVALAGHDHTYERFVRMDASGTRDPVGITSFVTGAGGKSLYAFGTPLTGSVARHNGTFGVLALRLGKGRYAWEYRTVEGKVVDAGSARCV